MIELTYPFTEERVRSLRVGTMVRVSGLVFTGRDRLHKFLAEGGICPVDFRDGAMYHCGPVMVRREGTWLVKAAGPTTSTRQDPYMARVIVERKLRVIIGKGGMGAATSRACREHGCVYVQAVGGAASLLASRVQQVLGQRYVEEFGSADALWMLQVEGLEGVVAMDTQGRSLYRRVELGSRRALKALIQKRLRSRE